MKTYDLTIRIEIPDDFNYLTLDDIGRCLVHEGKPYTVMRGLNFDQWVYFSFGSISLFKLNGWCLPKKPVVKVERVR